MKKANRLQHGMRIIAWSAGEGTIQNRDLLVRVAGPELREAGTSIQWQTSSVGSLDTRYDRVRRGNIRLRTLFSRFLPTVQGVEVPANARWLYVAGQVGVKLDGEVGSGSKAQGDQAWKNVLAVLKSAKHEHGRPNTR